MKSPKVSTASKAPGDRRNWTGSQWRFTCIQKKNTGNSFSSWLKISPKKKVPNFQVFLHIISTSWNNLCDVFPYTPHLLRFSETTQELPTNLALNNYGIYPIRSWEMCLNLGQEEVTGTANFGGWILRIEWYTPIKINILNLKITQLTEKNHRPNLHSWKACYLFRVYWVSTDSFAPRPFQSDQLQSTSTFMDAQQGKLFSADNVMDWSYQMMLQKWLWLFRSVFQALMKFMDKECTIIYHLIWVVPLRKRVANEGL